MSRFYDCDDGDYPAHWAQIDFERRVASRNGQAALRALAEALLALPERKLAHRMIVRGDGVPCTIGCYARDVAGLDLSKYVDREDDDHELTEWLGRKAGLAKALAVQLAYENDESFPPFHAVPVYGRVEMLSYARVGGTDCVAMVPQLGRIGVRLTGYTDEERWAGMYRRVCSLIRWQLPVPVAA